MCADIALEERAKLLAQEREEYNRRPLNIRREFKVVDVQRLETKRYVKTELKQDLLSDLPGHIRSMIFGLLDPMSLLAATRASKNWRYIVEHDNTLTMTLQEGLLRENYKRHTRWHCLQYVCVVVCYLVIGCVAVYNLS